MSSVWPVFTIGEIEFDELDDEVFLNDFESFQLAKTIPCDNLPNCKHADNDNNNAPNNEFSGSGSKQNLLRNKGSSVIKSNTRDNFGGNVRPSPVNGNALNPDGMNSNAKRTANFNDQSSLEPPLKKPSCVKENCIPTSRSDQLFNSLRFTKNKTSQPLTGSPKLLSEPKELPSDISLNKGVNFNADVRCRPMSNLSSGLRYTQNTALAVSSPSLTNDRIRNLGEAKRTTFSDQRRTPEINSISINTPNRYTERDSSRNLLRNSFSPSVNKQTPEFRRLTKDPSDHLTGTGVSLMQDNSLYYNKRKTDAIPTPPITPNRKIRGNSAIDRLSSSILLPDNNQAPTLNGFAKKSPDLIKGTPTAEMKSVTPKTRRFPGPAGILPRLDPGESLDNLPSPSAETPKKKSPELCHLVSDDSDEDFSIEPWILMRDKITRELPDFSDSLASVVKKAASRQLEKGKVAFLAVLVKSFRPTGLDVSIVLKDPSGEMRGTLHRKVVEQQQVELGPGCGLFLKQVSVFSPSPRKHYLNITPGNIIEIFPASADRCSSQTKIAEATPKRGPKDAEKQSIRSAASRDIEHVESLNETNFDELLKEFDEDDDNMLIEAMNF